MFYIFPRSVAPDETDISTQQNQKKENARLQGTHAHQKWPGCNQQKKVQGQEKIGSLTFPKHLRLLKRPLFQGCYKWGRRYATRHFIVFIRPNGLGHWRLGITASRKIGRAVVRNRIKRLVRETFRLHQKQVPGGLDIVVVCKKRPDIYKLNLDIVRGQIVNLLKQVRVPEKSGTKPENQLE